MGGAGFFGGDSSDHLGAIVEGLLGLEGALISSHSLADDFGVFINPDVGGSAEHFLDGFGEHFRLKLRYI